MSKAVPSDGTHQKEFEEFLGTFETLSDADVQKAMAYFERKKQTNNRPKLDDVTLEALMQAGGKFYARYRKCPNGLKKYIYIKLLQGKAGWDKGVDDKPGKKHPWD